MKQSQSGFSILIPLIIIVLVAVIGLAGFKVYQNSNNSDASSSSASIYSEEANLATKEYGDTITDKYGREHTRQDNTTVKIIGYNATAYGNDPSKFATLDNPNNWPIYTYESIDPTKTDYAVISTYVKSPSGKYIHLSRVTGVGGDCPPQDDKYTLVKKLSTGVENTFFTQYQVDGSTDKAVFSIEKFTTPERNGYNTEYVDGIERHNLLKEGDSNSNSCYTSGYSFVGTGDIYMTVRNDTEASLSSNLSWDDIKDDQQFVDMMQSLRIY